MIGCKLEKISLSYGPRKIISDLSFNTEDSLFVGITGASGAGKSSILQLLAGVSRANITGSVVWYNNAHQIKLPRPIGLVQQGSPIPGWLTVGDFLQMSAGKTGCTLKQKESILEQFQLDPQIVMRLFPHELSGGMRARVALAGAMNSGADVLLLDEPFSGVDELTRQELVQLLKTKSKDSCQTCFLVSHVLLDIMYLCDKVLVLKNPPSADYLEVQGFREKVGNLKELMVGDLAVKLYELKEKLSR